MGLLHLLDEGLEILIGYGIFILEFIGVIVLLTSAFKGVVAWVRKASNVRLIVAQGIALSLEFKLGGEVLRTVVVRNWDELKILGAIIVLRAALTFLIHWEIKHEEAHLEENPEKEEVV